MLVEAATRWYLRNPPGDDLRESIENGREGLRRFAEALPRIGSEAWHEERDGVAAALIERGVPEDLARDHAYGRALGYAPDVTAVAARRERPVDDVARAFFRVDGELGLSWVERAIERLPVGTRMQRWALQALRDDLIEARCRLSERALEEAGGAADPDEAVDRFLETRGERRARLTMLTRALSGENEADLAGLTLVVRQLQALV